MKNPFVYGVEVSGENFVDREEELRELANELLSGKSVLLLTPRRLGKTSLIREFFRRHRDEIISAHIKLYETGSETALAEKILEEISASAYSGFEKALRAAQKFFRELRPSFTLTKDGGIRVELHREITQPELEEVLDFPEKVGRESGRRVVVAFDEFQEICLFNGLRLEKLMKSKFEGHEHASYIFAGSKRHLLLEIFSKEDRPLFRFAKPMELGYISAGDFKPFIVEKFHRTGGSIAEEVVDRILEYTQGHPYFTQQLCHELWNLSREVGDPSEVERAVDLIVAHHSVEYEQIWDMLRSSSQRNLLRGLSLEPGANIYSRGFIERYGLGTASHVKKAYEALKEKGIIEEVAGGRGKISDIFFAEWVKRLSGGRTSV